MSVAYFHRLKLAIAAGLALAIAAPATQIHAQALTAADFGSIERLEVKRNFRVIQGGVSSANDIRVVGQTVSGARNARMALHMGKLAAVGTVCIGSTLGACGVGIAVVLAASAALSYLTEETPDGTLQAQRDHASMYCGFAVTVVAVGDCVQEFVTGSGGVYKGYHIVRAQFFASDFVSSSDCNAASIDAHYVLFGTPRVQHYDPNNANTSRIPHGTQFGQRCHLINGVYKKLLVSALRMFDDAAYNKLMNADWDGFRQAVSAAMQPGATGPLGFNGAPTNTLADLRADTLANTYFRGSSGQLVSPWGTDADGNMYMPDVFQDLDKFPDAIGPDDRASDGRQLMTGTKGFNYATGVMDGSTPDSQGIYDTADDRFFLPVCSYCKGQPGEVTETNAPPMEERATYGATLPGTATGTTTNTTTNPDGTTTTTTGTTTINLQLPSRFAVDVMSIPRIQVDPNTMSQAVTQGLTSTNTQLASVTAEVQGLRSDLAAPVAEPTDLNAEGSWLALPSFSLGTRWLPSTCPAPRQLSIMGKTHSMSFQPFCDIAGYLSILVLASAALSSFAIAFGGGKK